MVIPGATLSPEPEDGTGRRHCSVRERIHALVEPMPMSAVRELYAIMEHGDEIAAEDQAAVKAAFVERLNQFRPQRARRLFSELFVDIWVDDPILLRSRRPVPGLVQRIDVAALWRQLSRGPLVDVADAAQQVIDRLATTMLINDAMRTPKAKAVQEQMRLAAVRALDDLLAAGTKAAKAFLDALNRHRESEARALSGVLDPIVPLDRSFLHFTRDYLASLTLCARALAAPGLLAEGEPGSESETEREADDLFAADRSLRRQLGDSAEHSELAGLIPLIQLHVRRRHGAVALYLRETEGNGARGSALADALFCHFESSCRALVTALESTLRIEARTKEASVRITRRDRATVETAMTRLESELSALILAGMLESRHTEPQFRATWQTASGFVTDRLVTIVGQRVTLALTTRYQELPDQSDVVWLIRLIWSWHHLGRRFGLGEQAFFLKWRTRLMEDVRSALDKAIRYEDGETHSHRLEHLLRLNAIAEAIGHKISPFLPVSSVNIVRMTGEAILSGHGRLGGARRTLLEDFLGQVRAELRKSRGWQCPELVKLSRIADAHGL